MTTEERLNKIESDLQSMLALQRMTLLAAGGSLPVTAIGNTFVGDTIGTTLGYFRAWENQLGRLVAAKVAASFVVAGSAVNLSISDDISNNGVVDTLSSTGKVISDTIWVKPGENLWIGTADSAFSLTGSTFRVLLFDPLSFRGFLGSGV